ncbi:Phosphatase YfbT [Kluyvera intermedia]|nr:Phosphatase YfbT [Kluyvera intermedia]
MIWTVRWWIHCLWLNAPGNSGAESYGVDPDAVLEFIHGKQAITTLRHFMPGKSEAEIQAEFLRLEHIESTDLEGIRALPGAVELLEHLEANAIPWAIVTSGSIPVAHARHRAAGLLTPKVFVTAEQVKHGKPRPDAYLLGAELLGLPPQMCLVVEDAQAGIQSGIAAGCLVAAVNVPPETPELLEVDFVLSTLAALRVEKLPDNQVNVTQNA